jgi:hypothetical protein
MLTSPYSGRRAAIGFTKSTTRDTTSASVDYWVPFAAYSFNEKVTKAKDDNGLGYLESPRGADIIKRWNEGDIEFNIRDKFIGLLLLSLFGSESNAAASPQAGCGTHTFSVAESNQHQSLNIWKKTPVEALQAGNCMINSFSLKAVLDQYVRATVGFLGKQFGNDVATVTEVLENKFRPQDLSIKLASDVASLSGASAITTIRSLTLDINKNVEDYQGLGNVNPVDFVNRDFSFSLEVELALEAQTYKNLVLNNALQAASIKMTNNSVIIGTSTNPSLEFVADQLHFESFDVDDSLENIVKLTLRAEGTYHAGNARALRAILINSKTTAY